MVDQSSVEVPRPEEKPDSPTCSSSRAASARGYQSRPAPRPAFFRCGRSPQGEAGQSGTIVLRVEPVQLVVLGEDGAVRLAARAVVLLLGVEAVELVLLLRTAVEGAEVDVRRPVLGGRGDAQLAEENDAVGRLGNANLLEVVRREADQLIVAEVRLSGPSVKTRRGGGQGGTTYHGLEVLGLMLYAHVSLESNLRWWKLGFLLPHCCAHVSCG